MAIFHREKDKLHNKELKSLVLQVEGIFFDKHLKLVAAESRRDGGQIASRAVEDGIDLLVLASILGHSNLKMVMRYAHPSETFKPTRLKEWRLIKKQKQSKNNQFATLGYIIRYSSVFSYHLALCKHNEINAL